MSLFKNENDSKKEYGIGLLNIFESKIGIKENKNLQLLNSSKSSSNFIDNKIILKYHITPPEAEPFINKNYDPLIMHIYVIEALNIPKMDITSKTDPYVVCKFEKDKLGIKTKVLNNTLTPQWNQLLDLIITDSNENLIIEIWDKNIRKDKIICSTKLNINKYLNGVPYFEWIKMNEKILLNLAIQVKAKNEIFLSQNEVNKYQLSPIPKT